MLTDKALEELRQERHDDYVAETCQESAEAAQRAAHHVTGCAIDSVERLEGGAA